MDRSVLGHFQDGAFLNADGSWTFSPDYTYSWILSSLTFSVTVLLGSFAGIMMKEGKDYPKKVVCSLFIVGVALVFAGWLWSFQMPIIKRLWTGSMTLFSGGLCFLLMALFYYWVDYKGRIRGLGWLKIYGMNCITAYVLGEVINFRGIAHSVFYGLQSFMGPYYSGWLTFCNFLILFFILRLMYRNQVFIKI